MTDWRAWHSDYDEPDSSLARRLGVVRSRIGEALESLASGTRLRILSLCAGDGRDLLPELAVLADRRHRVALVENDPRLAADAAERARRLGLGGVVVVIGDAGQTSVLSEHLPVDLLLLCGIFGNISQEDVRATVAATPAMLRPGGTVIWTRGRSEPDLRPLVRRWFVDTGLEEIGFDGEPERYGVGAARLKSVPVPPPSLPERLFAFTR